MPRTRVDIEKDISAHRGSLENIDIFLNKYADSNSDYDPEYQKSLKCRAEWASELSGFEQELAQAKARGEKGRTPAEIREEITDLQSKAAPFRSNLNMADRNSMQWAMNNSLVQSLQCQINVLQQALSEAVEEEREERERPEKYERLVQEINKASTEEEYEKLTQDFRSMFNYKDAAALAGKCDAQYRALKKQREERERQEKYERLVQGMNKVSTEKEYEKFTQDFRSMSNYKDAAVLADKCDAQYRALKERREAEEQERQRIAEEKRKMEEKAKRKRIAILIMIGLGIIAAGIIFFVIRQKSIATAPSQMSYVREGPSTDVEVPESYNDSSSNNTQQSQNIFQATHKVVTDDGTNLRLRDGPGFNASQIGSLEYGASVKVLETGESAVDSDGNRGNWTYVSTSDGKTGWCFGAYLQLLP